MATIRSDNAHNAVQNVDIDVRGHCASRVFLFYFIFSL